MLNKRATLPPNEKPFIEPKLFYFGFLRAQRGEIALAITISFVLTGLSLVPAISFSFVVDRVIGSKDHNEVVFVFGIVALLYALEAYLTRVLRNITWSINEKSIDQLQGNWDKALSRSKLVYIERLNPARIEVVLRSVRDIVIQSVNFLVSGLPTPFFLAASLITISLLNIWIGLTSSLLTCAYGYLNYRITTKLKIGNRDVNTYSRKALQSLSEYAHGYVAMMGLGNVGFMRNRWASDQALCSQVQRRQAGLMQDQEELAQAYARASLAIVLCGGALGVIEGHISIGHMILINMIFRQMTIHIRRIIPMLQQRTVTFGLISEVNDTVRSLGDSAIDGSEMTRISLNKISASNINFKYPETDRSTLNDVSFEIRKGEMIAILGESGSGKTTLLKIISGLYEPSAGAISHEIAEFDNGHSGSAYNSQGEYVFSGTIAENIRSGRSTLDQDDLASICRDLKITSFLQGKKDIDSAELLAAGRNLSGGQRQRIHLARALASKPSVLALDEPTSALDSDTERNVIDLLQKLKKSMAIVVATHRLAPALSADRIIYIDKGRVVESGTPQELLARPQSRFFRLTQDHISLRRADY